jgi:hypothetical protein
MSASGTEGRGRGGGGRARAGRPLSARERALLDFERDWPVHQGRKHVAIRERFGISTARYHQLLSGLLDRPAAAAYDPLVVARLRRRRDHRQRQHVARTLGHRPDG